MRESIKKRDEFLALAKSPTKFVAGDFILSCAKAATAGNPRYGIVATKRVFANSAVLRNRARRIIRELVRRADKNGWMSPELDYSIMARRSILDTRFSKMKNDFRLAVKTTNKKAVL